MSFFDTTGCCYANATANGLNGLTCERHPNSKVIRTNSHNDPNTTIRVGNIGAILPLTVPNGQGGLVPADMAVYIQLAAWLAFDQFNRRSGDVIAELPQRLKHCDLYLTWEHYNSMFSTIRSAKLFIDGQMDVETSCPPFAVLGTARSQSTKPLAILGNAYNVPVMSSIATSLDLDGLPNFARTSPTTVGDAQAFATYLSVLDVSHTAIIYKFDVWGIGFHSVLVQELRKQNITTLSLPFNEVKAGTEEAHATIQPVIQQLAKSQYRYIIALITDDSWIEICLTGYEHGVMGHPGYTWMFTSASGLQGGFQISKNDTPVAKAMHGSSVMLIDIPTHQPFEENMKRLVEDPQMQKDFVRHFKQPQFFNDYKFENTRVSMFSYLTFDAAMALGIAACETKATDNDAGFFTQEQFYATLLETSFQGVTGPVSFNPGTHDRNTSAIQFVVKNFLLDEVASNASETSLIFNSQLSSRIHIANNSVQVIQPYIYADNTTHQPLSLPSLVVQQNLVPTGAYILGAILGILTMIASLGCLLWTIYWRNSAVVRASQPIFLAQCSIGCFMIAFTIIPLSLQDSLFSQTALDQACRAIPGIFSAGFVTAFSALFAKTWRLNRLFKAGIACRRIQVQPRDVIWPFVGLMTANIIIVLTWSFVHPIKWKRFDVSNFDSFGRVQESYGDCYANNSYAFLVPWLGVNFIPVIIAIHQSWESRNLPVEFSESHYLTLSVASLLETSVLAIPVIFASVGNPTASYILRSLFVCVFALTILLPIFVPKYQQLRQTQTGTAKTTTRAVVNSMARTGNNNYDFESNSRKEAVPSVSDPIRDGGTTGAVVVGGGVVGGGVRRSGQAGVAATVRVDHA